MPDIPQDVNQRITNAARDLAYARMALERAQGFEAQQAAQKRFDQCEEAMNNAALYINRGDYRACSE